MKATIVDLRHRTKDVLKAVERGETVAVLYRGKEKARIVPSSVEQAKTSLKNHRALRNVEGPERFSKCGSVRARPQEETQL